MILVYATSAPGYFCCISLIGNFPCSPLSTAQLQQLYRRFPIFEYLAVLNPFTMLSTLQLWTALGLLITWVEASQDHGMQLSQI
jgi:hypothetical protein